jgi:sugar lactone lactonase YvrE
MILAKWLLINLFKVHYKTKRMNIKFNAITETDFELYANCPCTVAEGPLWDNKQQTLYWIDVTNGQVYVKKDNTGINDYKQFILNIGKIGGMIFLNDNKLLLFAANGKVWLWSPDTSPELYNELPEAYNSRFNDVICDPQGRVFCGVAPAEKGGQGSLWRMDMDNTFSCIEPFVEGMPNGMGISPDLKYFYFTVTNERVIYRYSYDRITGNLSDKMKFIIVPDNEGLPDGMTVDADGCIWSAQWNGNRLVKYSPEGNKISEYFLPIEKISCAAFGGKDFSEMFVTTANYPWNENDYKQIHAGTVLKFKHSIKGIPEYRRAI